MSTTEAFKNTIREHLENVAKKDPLFAETFEKPKKNIDDCVTYILNQVKASGCSGFSDDEIFGMAMHYYDEDDLKPGDKITAKVVINRSAELTEADLDKAKQEALERVIAEEEKRIRERPKKAKAKTVLPETPSLFDGL